MWRWRMTMLMSISTRIPMARHRKSTIENWKFEWNLHSHRIDCRSSVANASLVGWLIEYVVNTYVNIQCHHITQCPHFTFHCHPHRIAHSKWWILIKTLELNFLFTITRRSKSKRIWPFQINSIQSKVKLLILMNGTAIWAYRTHIPWHAVINKQL